MPCTDCHIASAANVAASEASRLQSQGLISVNSAISSFVRKPGVPLGGGVRPSTNCGDHEVLTLQETAELLRVGTAVVVGLVRRGELAHKRVGRAYRFQRRVVRAWLDDGSATPTTTLSTEPEPRRPMRGAEMESPR